MPDQPDSIALDRGASRDRCSNERRSWLQRLASALLSALLIVPIAHATPGWLRNVGPGAQLDAADVALGDLDGDGDLDAYIVMGRVSNPDSSETALVDRIWENRSGALVDIGPGVDGGAPTPGENVALVDVDGDGDLDIVLAASRVYLGPGSGNVLTPTRIYLNTGSGVLNAARFVLAGQELTAGVSRMAVGDWDNDGDPDLVLGLLSGNIEAWVNMGGDQGGVAGSFFLVQTIPGSPSPPIAALALGNLILDERLDLVAVDADQQVQVRAGLAGSAPFTNFGPAVPIEYPPPISGQPTTPSVRDLVVGQLDGVGTDELLVVTNLGATLFTFAGSGVPVALPYEFPRENLEAGLIVDLNDDGRNDLVLGRANATTGGGVRYIGNLVGGNLQASAQCFGSQFLVRAMAAGDIDGDGLPDLLVAGTGGQPAQFPGQPALLPGLLSDGATVYRNDAAFGLDACCAVESAANAPLPALEKRLLESALATAKRIAQAGIDLGALEILRRDSLAVTEDGQRISARYDQFSNEVVALMLADPELARLGRDALAAWRANLVAMNRWRGNTATITQPQVAAMDQFLLALSAAGSPALAQMIADERAQVPPFATFVGMNMNQFRETVIDYPITFRDGFEN